MSINLFSELSVLLEERLKALSDKPEETPESTLQALWWKAAGRPASVQAVRGQIIPELDESGELVLRELVERRLSGVPLGHLTGRVRFLDVEMKVGRGALLPRQETEILGGAALEALRRLEDEINDRELLVADVCTGAGNLAVAFAKHCTCARVVGTDLSEEAIDVARENAAFVKVTERVEFRVGDLNEPIRNLSGQIDLLTCNPPYISSAKVPEMASEISEHEPSLAFDGGPFGIKILARLLKDAPSLLRPSGWLGFEVGLGQGPAMAKKLEKDSAFSDVRALMDVGGEIRALLARVNADEEAR